MERKKGCLPFRYLHKYEPIATNTTSTSNNSNTDNDTRYVILKRTGPAGHFQYIEELCTSRACFTSHNLPDVFKSLWKLEL